MLLKGRKQIDLPYFTIETREVHPRRRKQMRTSLDLKFPVVNDQMFRQNVRVTRPHPRYNEQAEPLLITTDSPMVLRRGVETLARYFRREFGYDFVNFSAEGCATDCEAWLWVANGGNGSHYAVGHSVFWQKTYSNRPGPEWELTSVWLHPFMRNRGRLTRVWPHWQESYGPFWIELPLSAGMRKFLRGTHHELPDGTIAKDVLDKWYPVEAGES